MRNDVKSVWQIIILVRCYGCLSKRLERKRVFLKNKQREPIVEPYITRKLTAAFLREDYPYKAIRDTITDLDALDQSVV